MDLVMAVDMATVEATVAEAMEVKATVVEATVVEATAVKVMVMEAMVVLKEDMVAVMEAVRVDGPVNKAVVVGLTIIKSTLEILTFHQAMEHLTVTVDIAVATPVSAQNILSATTMAIAGNCQL